MENLNLGILQYDVQWEDKSANFDIIDSLLSANFNEQDLIILPEMFSTGFSMSPVHLGEDLDGITVQRLLKWSSKFDCCFCGSFICNVNGGYTNKFVAVFPDGSIAEYDKKYLFTPAGESDAYQAGNKIMTFMVNDWAICPLICYDLRFPEWPRSSASNIDLIIYTASWPEARIKQWDKLLSARAIENQCYSVGVNRIGADGNGFSYNGHSVIKDHDGETVLFCSDQKGFYSMELKAKHLIFREKIDFLSDKKPFQFI